MYHAICIATGDTIHPVIKEKFPSAVILPEDGTNCIFVDSVDFKKHETMTAKMALLMKQKAAIVHAIEKLLLEQ